MTRRPILLKPWTMQTLKFEIEAIRALGACGVAVASAPIIDRLLLALSTDGTDELRIASIETLDSLARDQDRVAHAIAAAASGDASDPSSQASGGPDQAADIRVPGSRFDRCARGFRPASAVVGWPTNLASIGLADDRVVPALCNAALKSDDVTREGIETNFGQLNFARTNDKTAPDEMARRFQLAIGEIDAVLKTRKAVAREPMIDVLGRIIGRYQVTHDRVLLKSARDALQTLFDRIEDEKEDVAVRRHAINQWPVIQMLERPTLSKAHASSSNALAAKDELQVLALWIEPLCRMLNSSLWDLSHRAGQILIESFESSDGSPALRAAWRKGVPWLAKATSSADPTVRSGTLTILGQLGPEAGDALAPVQLLMSSSEDASAAVGRRRSVEVDILRRRIDRQRSSGARRGMQDNRSPRFARDFRRADLDPQSFRS